jgi:hypothetical protein
MLIGKCEGKRPFGRLRRGYDSNIKMNVKEIGYGDVVWNHMVQDGV